MACGPAGGSCRAAGRGRLSHEPLLPPPHDGFGAPGATHDRIGAKAIGGQQDDVRPLDMFLRAVAVRYYCPNESTLGAGHIDDDPLAHPPDSHAQGEWNPQRDSNVRLYALGGERQVFER